MTQSSTAPIRLGFIVTSGEAIRRLSEKDIGLALKRHAAGDWGECDEDARAKNNRALQEGNDLYSLYRSETGEHFCILTLEGRETTSIRMLDEYQDFVAELH